MNTALFPRDDWLMKKCEDSHQKSTCVFKETLSDASCAAGCRDVSSDLILQIYVHREKEGKLFHSTNVAGLHLGGFTLHFIHNPEQNNTPGTTPPI